MCVQCMCVQVRVYMCAQVCMYASVHIHICGCLHESAHECGSQSMTEGIIPSLGASHSFFLV